MKDDRDWTDGGGVAAHGRDLRRLACDFLFQRFHFGELHLRHLQRDPESVMPEVR